MDDNKTANRYREMVFGSLAVNGLGGGGAETGS